MIYSDRPQIAVFSYRGWRPLRALALVAIGILAGFLTAKEHAPASGPALVADCPR